MGLEAASYVNGLVATNPLTSDPKSAGDDHFRLIKAVLVASFPNVGGAVTVSHTVLNAVQDAANLTSGVLANARVQQSNVTQHQAALALAASQITSGTLANALVAQSNVTQHQAALALAASQITSGVLAVAQGGTGQASEIAFARRVTLNYTIQSDPGTTPSGTAGDVFEYY